METTKQAYWKREHDIRSKTNARTSYVKRQYHKARRRHDEEVIEEHLEDIRNTRITKQTKQQV